VILKLISKLQYHFFKSGKLSLQIGGIVVGALRAHSLVQVLRVVHLAESVWSSALALMTVVHVGLLHIFNL
jgi:hypothetical protein|tara:strand:- start:810 stop:1022 length:213 start_codon:yes stop_codon:yes gene_type:complete